MLDEKKIEEKILEDSINRIDRELNIIVSEFYERDNLAEIYARYDNRLRIEVDSDDEEEVYFLRRIVRFIEDVMINLYMSKSDYLRDIDDMYGRWVKRN